MRLGKRIALIALASIAFAAGFAAIETILSASSFSLTGFGNVVFDGFVFIFAVMLTAYMVSIALLLVCSPSAAGIALITLIWLAMEIMGIGVVIAAPMDLTNWLRRIFLIAVTIISFWLAVRDKAAKTRVESRQ